MSLSNQLKNQHLLWRAAFGPMAENEVDLDALSQNDLWKLLLKTSSKEPDKIEVAKNLIEGLYKGVKDIADMQKMELSKEQKKQLREQSREDIKNLNLRWLGEMINSEAQLREKISLFWHGHFACRVINSYFQQELLHTIRTNALGNFGDLLKGISRSPAMLQFLNNQQNKKAHPNENFAREVMELFTMGRGNYTENDIKEAARAFTGWGFNLKGEFVFRRMLHDTSDKTFLGKTGNFDGDDIIDMLLEQQQTATYITKKIYRYFVNEDLDEGKVSFLAMRFYNNKYDIKSLLQDIFTSAWFYDIKNIGVKIKSPVELLAGIRRFMPLELDNDSVQLLFQKVLGQVLFYPPNVAGWPGGKSWIDSSSLMVRLQVPQVLTAKESLNIQAKTDDDQNMGQMIENDLQTRRNKLYVDRGGSASIDWAAVIKIFENVSREDLVQRISDTLLQTNSRIPVTLLNKYLNSDSRENFIKGAIVKLMSTPEYQLC